MGGGEPETMIERLHGCPVTVHIRDDVPTDRVEFFALCRGLGIGAISSADRGVVGNAPNMVSWWVSRALTVELEAVVDELVLAGGSAS